MNKNKGFALIELIIVITIIGIIASVALPGYNSYKERVRISDTRREACAQIRIGDHVQVLLPDGQWFETQVNGVEWEYTPDRKRRSVTPGEICRQIIGVKFPGYGHQFLFPEEKYRR